MNYYAIPINDWAGFNFAEICDSVSQFYYVSDAITSSALKKYSVVRWLCKNITYLYFVYGLLKLKL